MSIKIYHYNNCSTCKSALKFLDAHKAKYQAFPIVDQPPTVKELQLMLSFIKKDGGTFKKLFNTSGVQYREDKIADRIANGMNETEALSLLSQNGKLIKRPFLLTDSVGVVGFNSETYKRLIEEQ